MELVPTGIQGLDEMTGGGLPRGRVILVCGGPGSGKTIMATHFLVHGVEKFDEPGLYATLEEKPEHIREDMRSLGWDLESYEKTGKLGVVDFSPVVHLSPQDFKKAARGTLKMAEFTIETISYAIRERAKEMGAKRIVVDPMTSLSIMEPDKAKRRRNMVHLISALLDTKCTSLVTSEVRHDALVRQFQFEEYLAQGAIVLETIFKGGEMVRALHIEKLRGVAHDTQPRPYRVTNRGIVVYSKERIL
ncbi:MAG: ATPase domain-containing protein [archaeon]